MNQVPNNLMAEQNVIGGLLLDPQSDNAQSIFSLLKPEDFYARHHQIIYLTLREMYTQRMPIDIMTVTDCLESKGRINQSGGFAYLAEMARET
ncbi:DnaB-like helicase N-terminal domain-containing protein, partial [Proteus mirabilis]